MADVGGCGGEGSGVTVFSVCYFPNKIASGPVETHYRSSRTRENRRRSRERIDFEKFTHVSSGAKSRMYYLSWPSCGVAAAVESDSEETGNCLTQFKWVPNYSAYLPMILYDYTPLLLSSP